MSIGEILGLVAGAFSTGSILPQVVRIFRNRSAKDVSLWFTIMILTGSLLWLSYGILDRLLPVILWNSAGTMLTAALVIGKVRFDFLSRKNLAKLQN